LELAAEDRNLVVKAAALRREVRRGRARVREAGERLEVAKLVDRRELALRDGVKDVRGSESNCEQDSCKM
jgi:hypothetical protein